ncbi:RAD51-associated protein 1 isoform X1 [Neopelma chrysocephalum]|uniref:RAD51-associated protein 1 isoform X1 n=1 Tax=Neopelma chrysocephalum TaxID=114329 RepID=UPI000FCD41F2|nr:RAD51-associated protein 1 isoform X1 [Neopelma chrysocephalum]
MARPGRRNRKVVDYSQFGDLEDDDEDFAPSSKKSKTQPKEPKKEKKEKQKKPPKEVTQSQTQALSKRLSLDDKLYKRDLEVALALSVKEKSANILEVQNSEEQDKSIESENIHRRPPFSNCSVDSEVLGLNQVMDEDIPKGDGGKRTVTSKVPARQKVVDSDDREHDTDSEPESVPTSPVVSPSWTMEQKPEPRQKMVSNSSEPVGRPLLASSPITHKKPKWTPPAPSGSSNSSGKYVAVKSPTHCLRLGLSRLARVKPLHPSATSS